MVRLNGWSPCGERLVADAPMGHWETITFIAGLRQTGIVAPMLIKGAMNGEAFLAYIEQCLAPTLKRGDIVVADNVSFHKIAGVEEALRGVGASLRFLPQYSPDLNPIHKGHRQDLAYLIVRGPRDTHGPCVRQCLQPRGNVHAIAEQIPSAHHHVTDMHTNAKIDALVGWDTRVRLGQSSLGLHRALYGINGTSELRKDTIARRVRYAAPVFPNEPVADRAPFGQPFERADLVSAHEPGVALHIRCEDCNEASADFRRV
jgi:hypothetical protein